MIEQSCSLIALEEKKTAKTTLSYNVYNNPPQPIYGFEIARSLYYINSPY